MARQVNISIIDDLDGKSVADETVEFSIDGTTYEIDLCEKNAEKLRKELGTFVAAARKVVGAAKKARRVKSSEDLAAVREWALSNGMKVSNRGRVPREIITAYHNRGAKDRVVTALSKVKPVDEPELSQAQ